jgi:hypothetical protein
MTGDAARGFTDWASLSFLSRLPETRDIAPCFYGGDLDARVMVMEDLGGSRTLEDLLNGTDRKAVLEALRALAVQTARLNAGTAGREQFYEERRRMRLPGAPDLSRRQEAQVWLGGREKMLRWFQELDCPAPPGFDDCLAHVAEMYAEPGPFLAFTHGDPAPTNNHVGPRGVRLLDFEYAGYRHALYDITGWNVLCPLPEAVIAEMSRCYRSELEKALPIARDDGYYDEAWGCVSAYRALAMLTWIRPESLRENRPWAGDWTAREAILSTVARLRDAAALAAKLEALAGAAAGLEAALRRRWPEYGDDVLPRWPALKAA